jgi:carbon monoxide dehydrogenase subunit G
MLRIDGSIEVAAPPETVWSILLDRENEFKFYPALVSHVIDPPGLAVLGQKSHSKAKIGGMKVETFTEIAEFEPNKKLVFRQRQGSFLKSFAQTITLEPMESGTKVTQVGEFEVSMGYLGIILRKLVVNRAIRKNLDTFLESLKELAEAKEPPQTT